MNAAPRFRGGKGESAVGTRFLRNLFATALITLCVVTAGSPRHTAAQNVDWLSSDQAAQLDLGFSVLVPSWVPGPFGGSPSIQASGGYYSLYWMNGGGAPTFLQITGEVGGGLPAGSPADLNNQLFINASVQGYDAIHDVTTIYDNVWWIAGGVLYTVSSNNMTGTDSLSLANSLIPLEAPAYVPPTEEPTQVATEVPTEVATEVPAEAPTDVATEAATEEPADDATDVSAPSPTPADDGTGGNQDSVEAVATETQASSVMDDGTGGSLANSGTETPVTQVPQTETPVTAQTQSPVSGGTNGAPLSDGTAGPQLPPGSDGTGGIWQIVLP
jgi:hypothetical protein